MEIQFKEKPSSEIINTYCGKLEKFLSAHGVCIQLLTWDVAPMLTSTVNGIETSRKMMWLSHIVVSNPGFGDLEVDVPRSGINATLSDRDIWQDAWQIQNDMYRHLEKEPSVGDMNDPYWRLWDLLVI